VPKSLFVKQLNDAMEAVAQEAGFSHFNGGKEAGK